MIRTDKNRRSERGSMLTMTIMVICLILFFCVAAFAFYMLLTEQKRGQSKTDEVAMNSAKFLNDQDRIGQMNTVVSRSRELLYYSRQVQDQTAYGRSLAFAAPLAQLLVNEARTGADTVEKARINALDLDRAQIHDVVDYYNSHLKSSAAVKLPWWQSYDPQVIQVDVGSVNNVTSNVVHNDLYPDLNDFDTEHKYVQKTSKLFLGNINAELPPPDNDLPFILSSVPAPVDRTIAPARMFNPDAWKYLGTVYKDGKFITNKIQYLPSAVAVYAKMDVASAKNRNSLLVGSFSGATGAAQPPSWVFDINQWTGPKPWGVQ